MYVDEEFYTDTYKGAKVDDFDSLEIRAAEIVEGMTRYRLNETTFAAMSEDVQTAVKKAVCAEIEYLDANGGSDMDNGVNVQSGTLGKFSFTYGGAAGASADAAQSIYAPRAVRILAPTGLLYRGGDCG